MQNNPVSCYHFSRVCYVYIHKYTFMNPWWKVRQEWWRHSIKKHNQWLFSVRFNPFTARTCLPVTPRLLSRLSVLFTRAQKIMTSGCKDVHCAVTVPYQRLYVSFGPLEKRKLRKAKVNSSREMVPSLSLSIVWNSFCNKENTFQGIVTPNDANIVPVLFPLKNLL